MGKVSLGEYWQMLLLALEVPTGCPRGNVYRVVQIMKEKRAQSQKNQLGVT